MNEAEFNRYKEFMAAHRAQFVLQTREIRAAQKSLTVKLNRLKRAMAEVSCMIDRLPRPRNRKLTETDRQINALFRQLKRCCIRPDADEPDAAAPDS
jgi:hypothetical protein